MVISIRQASLPGGSVVKNPPANAGNSGSIPDLGKSAGEGNGNPLQYSGLENSMDCIWLSNFHFSLSDMDYSSFLEIYTSTALSFIIL